jgi:hypothetical protein
LVAFSINGDPDKPPSIELNFLFRIFDLFIVVFVTITPDRLDLSKISIRTSIA